MVHVSQDRMDSKAGDTLSYSATRTGTCQTNSLSGVRPHQAYARVQENPASIGNAISRGNQTLIYDEENRLVEVQENSMTIMEYVYDGDGKRVQSVVTDGDQTIRTIYIGSYYEQITTVDGGSSTTDWKKYYYAGSVRLAMRENSEEPYYLISDHLGNTSLVVDSLRQEVARQSYLPLGEEWGSGVTDLLTTFTYTG